MMLLLQHWHKCSLFGGRKKNQPPCAFSCGMVKYLKPVTVASHIHSERNYGNQFRKQNFMGGQRRKRAAKMMGKIYDFLLKICEAVLSCVLVAFRNW